MVDILHVVDVQAPSSVVFDAINTVAGIRRWWTAKVEGSDDVGGSVTLLFGTKWKVVMQRIDSVPNTRVVYRITEHDSNEWPGTEICFELSEVDGWTTLKFDHRGWAESSDFFRFCSAKWVVFLLSIKQAAESGHGTPSPNETKIGRMD